MPANIHVWKACNRQKRFASSNLAHSAQNGRICDESPTNEQCIKTAQFVAIRRKKTAKQPQRMKKVHLSLFFGRSFDKFGTAPLMIAVNHNSSSCYIPLPGIRLRRDQWDKSRRRVVNHPRADTINSVAVSTLGRALDIVMSLGGVRGLTTAQVRDQIAERLFPPAMADTGVAAVMREYAALCGRENTADKYHQTLTHLGRWLGSRRLRQLQFADISPEWLAEFDRYLIAYCPSVNSRAIHMRNLRTVFNHALSRGITSARYPFKQFKIKTAPAAPVALSLEQLRRLWLYQPTAEPHRYALDIFRLSFALIGANLADLCELQSVSQGRVNYTRRKTGRVYSVKVEPPAAALIRGRRSGVSGRLLDILDRYKSVHVATSIINRNLKAIAEQLSLPPLTLYTARYTWATLAMSISIPIEVISQALGHTYGMAVTLGYIMPDRRRVDEANRQLLALL